jgi:thioredoxin reductase (NADPH)
VKKLHLIIRGLGLEASMSRYLIDRIRALPNVELHSHTEILSLHGSQADGLTGATFRDRQTGAEHHCEMQHLVLFIGADPNTDWLNRCVALDPKGFILTGPAVAPGASERTLLETSRPRIFAIGDVRAGSTKRVAAAVGEGAAVVAQIHQALAG